MCVRAFAGDNVFISVATIHNLTSDVQKIYSSSVGSVVLTTRA